MAQARHRSLCDGRTAVHRILATYQGQRRALWTLRCASSRPSSHLLSHPFAQEFSQFKRTVNVDGRDVEVTLWDLEGARDIGRVRCLVYPNLGGVLVLFGVRYLVRVTGDLFLDP